MEFQLADFRVGVDNVIFSVDTDLKTIASLVGNNATKRGAIFGTQWWPGTLVRNGNH
jgi:hypothetical protein